MQTTSRTHPLGTPSVGGAYSSLAPRPHALRVRVQSALRTFASGGFGVSPKTYHSYARAVHILVLGWLLIVLQLERKVCFTCVTRAGTAPTPHASPSVPKHASLQNMLLLREDLHGAWADYEFGIDPDVCTVIVALQGSR